MSQTRFILSATNGEIAEAALREVNKLDHSIEVAKQLGAASCVLSCDQYAARCLEQSHGVFIEADQPLTPPEMPGLQPARSMLSTPGMIDTVVDTFGQAIPDATVFVHATQSQFRVKTGPDGKAELGLPRQTITHLIVSPAANFWSRLVLIDPSTPERMRITLIALQPEVFSTQIRSLLALPRQASAHDGAGIRVAVIDSGIATHPGLHVYGGYNTVDAIGNAAAWNADDSGHGTHCAGIIAAVDTERGYFGLAPGVHLYAVRVFPGGHVSDLIEALDWCVANNIDIANMSLSSPNYSAALDAAIQRAYAAGVTVVAAAGNQGSEVSYPARLNYAIGVAAYGHPHMFPNHSAHTLRIGTYTDHFGTAFSARFSNRGEGVSVIAPGVSIISTVPGGYAAWDGTSMATPLVTSHLARTLSRIKTSPMRASWQSAYLHHHVHTHSWPTGLPPFTEGNGQLF